jgi:hypothetical protein
MPAKQDDADRRPLDAEVRFHHRLEGNIVVLLNDGVALDRI